MSKIFTPKEYMAHLQQSITEFSFDNKFMFDAVSDTHAKYANRIFRSGRRSNLSNIGSYSTKPMIASRKTFTGLPNKFKVTKVSSTSVTYSSNVKSKKVSAKKGKQSTRDLWLAMPNKKTGKKNKAFPAMIIEGGYKQFKGLVGRRNDKVNFMLRGTLQTDVANRTPSAVKKGKFIYEVAVKNAENQKKVEGLMDKYGKDVWYLGQSERRDLVKELGLIGVKIISGDR